MLATFRWFLSSILGLLVAVGIVALSSNPDLQAGAAIAAIFLLLPVAILTYRDAVRRYSLQNAQRRGYATLLGLPLRLLGIVSLMLGCAVFLWVGYNVLVARQAEFTGISSLGQVAVLVLLVILGWRWIRKPLAGSD